MRYSRISRKNKIISVLSIVAGFLILFQPEIARGLIAIYFIVAGVLGLIEDI